MHARTQLWAGLLLLVGGVSYPVAFAANRFLHFDFAVAFVATALTLLFSIIGAYRYLRIRDALTSEIKKPHINAMAVSEAASAAEALLSDASKFLVVRRHTDEFPFAAELSHHVRVFFSEIESLKAVRGDAELVRRSISRSELNRNYIRIGRDIESVEVTVRPGDEIVYELDAFDPSKPFDQHRSIYHWLLAVDRALYGD